MKRRTWLLLLASTGSALILAILAMVWVAYALIGAWSNAKYSPRVPAAELPIEVVGR